MPLSAKQMEYLALAWQCFESEPKINYAKFATVAGLASAASARELMRVTKNKLKDEYGALSTGLQTSNTNTVPQPRTPKKKIAAAGTASATPASRKRVRKVVTDVEGVRENGEKENGEDDDEETAVSAPAAKKARTKAKANTTPVAAAAATTGGVKVKSEFGGENGLGFGEEVLAEEEVSIF